MKILCTTPVTHIEGIYEYMLEFGSVCYMPNADKNDLKQININEYNVIFCNPNNQNYVLDEECLQNFSGTILTASTGLNHIDLDYCNKLKINILSHTNDYEFLNNLPSTSELAFTLMMMLLRNTHKCKDHVSSFMWDHTKFMGRQVKGLTVGIIGFGRLGKMMHDYCKAFGANVIVCDPYKSQIETVDLETLIRDSDVISLHVHASEETRGMLNAHSLVNCKKDLNIINTARGCIVNESDIVDMIKNKNIAGYATDVVVNEFDDVKLSPIVNCMNDGYNIIVTPHIGGVTKEGLAIAYRWSLNKLKTLKINNHS